jgi:tRNA/rRNA methyltransferase
MSNFGVLRLRVVNPYEVAFREARSAVGAEALLREAEEYRNVAEAVADCHLVVGTTAGTRRDLNPSPQRLQEGARQVRQELQSGAVALLFGSEKRGLSNQDISYCHWLMRIPTRAEHPSMNLGQAVAVCLYELSREEPQNKPGGPLQTASAGEIERFTALLFQALQASGYVKARTAASSKEKLRRLALRLQLPARDAETWLGILRQINWKLGQT